MGGKTGTTTQSVNIPPEVMARYNAVNTRAESTAQQPFQQYSTSPESFVAQLNPQQQQGISNVNQYAGAAQPGYQAAMQGTAGAYGGLTPQGFQQGVQGYMSPFLSNAMGATAAQMQNVNRQQQQDIIGNAVKAGAFGGDRGAIARSALANQQNLAMGQTLGQMAQQGYQSAAQNYLTGLGQQGQLSAQMGALGAGAQQAGLQGAQAQIGAGTLGQQTEQAGKTALYNQFLQQQAYPFQVAQFLANIAMGTGALSGSQTTTTQPMSFFSDRRLKEDIKRIGETDEGLPIYKFKYKGDPEEQTHVGFMADEVEKVHPEAVGESHGYKTVDYDKATSEGGAVHEKHAGLGFALGGSPTAMDYGSYNPYDPYNIQNIISRQQAIFANPEAHYVPLARQISGGFGKHSRVPEAALPISQLKTAGPAPQMPESMLQQGLGFAERAEKIQNLFEKGKTALESMQKGRADLEASKSPQSSATSVPQVPQKKAGLYLEDDTAFAAHGGAIHGYAEGGLTPETQKDETPQGLYSSEQTGKLNIPTESKNYKLAQQSMLPGSMQDPTMKDIMTIIGMFKSHGGRAGYEGGGNVDVDPYLGALGKIESGGRYEALGPLTKGGDRAYGKYQVMGANIPSWTEEALGKRLSPEEFLANKEAQEATARHHFGKFVNQYGSPEDAASVWFSGKPMAAAGEAKDALGTTVPAYVQKFRSALAGSEAAPKSDLPPDGGALSSGKAAGLGLENIEARAGAPETKKTGGFGDLMTSQNIVPLLVGLGTMASSRSPFLGSAILEGLGGGAQAYAGMQKQAADIQATEAATKASEFETLRRSFQETPWGNIMWVRGPNGIYPKSAESFDPKTDIPAAPPATGTDAILRKYFGEPKQGGLAPATSAAPAAVEEKAPGLKVEPIQGTEIAPPAQGDVSGVQYLSYYDQKSAENAAKEKSRKGATAIAGGPTAGIPIEQSKAYVTQVNAFGAGSRENQQNIRELATTLADTVNQKGWSAPGTGFFPRAQIAGAVNTLLRAFNQEPVTDMDSQAQIIDKIRLLQGLTRASGAGQESVRALEELANANANPSQSPTAYARLVSQLMIQSKRGIDQSNHALNWGRDSGNMYVEAGQDFERVNPAEMYGKQAKAIEKILLERPDLFKKMIEGEYSADQIDKAFEAQGLKGMSTYFLGGK